MAETIERTSRRKQILQALAHMLEINPGGRITTSALAKEVGVSEAALYRHFPSKAKMFEGLIKFIENTLFIYSTPCNAMSLPRRNRHVIIYFQEARLKTIEIVLLDRFLKLPPHVSINTLDFFILR